MDAATTKVNAFITKARRVYFLQFDAEITVDIKEALDTVKMSSNSYYKYKDMEYQTTNIMKEVENRGTNKAYLCEEAVDELSKWNYRLGEEQKSPSAIDFKTKVMELRAKYTNSLVV